MARKILAIVTERPVFEDVDSFQLGDVVLDGSEIVAITRSVGGLADVTSIGPSGMGPNCPTFVLALKKDETTNFLAIPERMVISVLFVDPPSKKGKKGSEEADIEMTKEI